jgi:hypothetical protein
LVRERLFKALFSSTSNYKLRDINATYIEAVNEEEQTSFGYANESTYSIEQF